ncbi:hypothetical protein Tco_0221724 [Tanacetum coccineum]
MGLNCSSNVVSNTSGVTNAHAGLQTSPVAYQTGPPPYSGQTYAPPGFSLYRPNIQLRPNSLSILLLARLNPLVWPNPSVTRPYMSVVVPYIATGPTGTLGQATTLPHAFTAGTRHDPASAT